MSSKNIYTPFFYIIQHKESRKLYAGSCKSSDYLLFMKPGGYTTSSTEVNRILSEEGLESFDVIQIFLETYMDCTSYEYETRFLNEYDIASLPNWLNCHNNNTLSPFASDDFKKMLRKVHNVEYTSQIPEVKEKVSEALSGRINIFDSYEMTSKNVTIEEYESDRERYLHFSSYRYRNLMGITGKMTKRSDNYKDKVIAYNIKTKESKKISIELFETDDDWISTNSKEYCALTGKNHKPGGKKFFEIVLDLHDMTTFQAPIQLRYNDPERYLHINSAKAKEIKNQASSITLKEIMSIEEEH